MDIEDVINECVNIEVDEGLHVDKMEDYPSALDFYLSNITGDNKKDYLEHLIDYYDLSKQDAKYVYERVIDLIETDYQ